MVVVLTYTHSPCPDSPTGRTDFTLNVGQAQICPKCGQDIEVKPMFFEGKVTERSVIPSRETSQRPPTSGMRK